MKKYPSQLKAFGRHLKKIRAERGLSQQELANLCELELTLIGRLEIGAHAATLNTVFALCDGLGIEPRELLDFDRKKEV